MVISDKTQNGVRTDHDFSLNYSASREHCIICCKSTVALFEILISFKMYVVFIKFQAVKSSKLQILNQNGYRLLLANVLYTFLNYDFLENCIRFPQVI